MISLQIVMERLLDAVNYMHLCGGISLGVHSFYLVTHSLNSDPPRPQVGESDASRPRGAGPIHGASLAPSPDVNLFV